MIEYYRETLFVKKPFLVFVFGGAKIYQRACLKVCEIYNLNTFVLEHFFTGKHVYIEPQYEPIQNSTNAIERITKRALENDYPLQPISIELSNINVKSQPETFYTQEVLDLNKGKKIGCVILQVYDDYSLTNISDEFILSQELERLIDTALHENERVLIKLHPYELSKHGEYHTKNYIETKYLDEIESEKLFFIEGMEDEQILKCENFYGTVSQYALNLLLLGAEAKMHDAFFFHTVFDKIETFERTLLLHRITEYGLFDQSERSYNRVLSHLSQNLLPSIACTDKDISEFNNKVFLVKKSSKLTYQNTNSRFVGPRQTNKWRTFRNALRLLIVDPKTFKIKLYARLKL